MASHNQGWKLIPIETLCSRVTSGGTPLRSNQDFYAGGSIPWVKTGELKDWFIENTEEKITELAIEKSSAKLFPKETVLMAMYGDGRTITSLGILGSDAASNQACCAMIANRDVCLPLFLLYSLMAHRHELLKLAYGGAQRNLNAKTIRSFEIPVPPLPVQTYITDTLSTYDDLIENNTRRIKILEQMAQMLYREWFVNFRFPGHEKVKMVESEMGMIPEGWRLGRVADFGRVVTGKTPSTQISDYFNGAIPFIKTPDMHGHMFCLQTAESLSLLGADSQKGKTLPENSIIVNCIGALAGSVSITTEASQTNQQINAIVPTEKSTREFLYLTLLGLRDTLRQIGSNGATMINVNKTKFESLPVVIPTQEIMRSFHSFVGPLFESVKNLQERNINLRTTRDLLLPKLVSGEVSVEQTEKEAVAQMS